MINLNLSCVSATLASHSLGLMGLICIFEYALPYAYEDGHLMATDVLLMIFSLPVFIYILLYFYKIIFHYKCFKKDFNNVRKLSALSVLPITMSLIIQQNIGKSFH